MFNHSKILRSAWAAYRVARPCRFAAGDTATRRVFIRSLFATMLRNAWDDAKKAARSVAATAVAFVEAQRRVAQAKAADMDPMVRSARLSEIRDELNALDYAPLGVRTSQRRLNLGAELSVLQSAAV